MVTTPHRVVRLITRLNIGGPARQALLLTRELAADYPTTLAAGSPQEGEGEMSDPEVRVVKVPLVRPLRPVQDLHALRAVRKLIDEHRPALVHTHMAKAGSIGRIAARRVDARPRTVHTFHGHVLDGYFRPSVQNAFVRAERWLARRTDVLVAVSAEIRDQLLELGIGTPGQYEVIPLGFDLRPFLELEHGDGSFRDELGLDRVTPLIGVLGRLAPIKDHACLLRAMVRIPSAHLAVLGEGELLPELKGMARSLAIVDRVHFVGWRTDVARPIADIDIVALTSRNEGSPVSLIEALAGGKPVVATDVGGVRSVVREGVTGYMTAAGDVDAIADRINQLIANPGLRKRMGEAGRTDAMSRYGKERLLQEIRALYASLVGESR